METFRSIPIFSECDPVHLQLLAFAAVRETYAPGQTLIRQGERQAAAHLILDGEVALSSAEAGPIGTAGPGALLGEMAMIGDRPYAITATAAGEVTAARIDRELFMRVVREFPEFGVAVFRMLARKVELSLGELDATRDAFEKARSFKRP